DCGFRVLGQVLIPNKSSSVSSVRHDLSPWWFFCGRKDQNEPRLLLFLDHCVTSMQVMSHEFRVLACGRIKTQNSTFKRPRLGRRAAPVMKVRTGLNTYMVFLKLQANLAGERSASGFGRDLTKGTGVDIQVRSSRRRVIEDIASVKPDCHAPRFCDSDLLLQIRIEIPIAGPINR